MCHFDVRGWLINVPRAGVTPELPPPRDMNEVSVSSKGQHTLLSQSLRWEDWVAKAGVWRFPTVLLFQQVEGMLAIVGGQQGQ